LSIVPHNRPTLGPEEAAAANAAIASGWVAQGPKVAAFEDDLCRFLGLPEGHAVAVSSGSAALFLALWALGARGQAVACPVYACSALPNAIRLAGGTPIFVDVDDGPNVSAAALAVTGAFIGIAAHMFGLPQKLGRDNGIRLIEDCAQAIGARCEGAAVGTQGDIGIFSFYATKMMTTGGQGGALVSRDWALVDAVRDYRQFDCREDKKPRFNFQMTDPQAAVGSVQLGRLPQFLARRQTLFAAYRAAGIDLMESSQGAARYRAVTCVTEPDRVLAHLKEAGISAIIPIQDWELLDTPNAFEHAHALSRKAISLPLYPSLTDDEQKRVIAALADA